VRWSRVSYDQRVVIRRQLVEGSQAKLRRGFTVALVGADGAGKSTVAHRLVDAVELPARYLYMGVNLETSSVVLPTTWLLLTAKRLRGGRPDMAPHGPTASGPAGLAGRRGRLGEARQAVRITNLIAEEWFRQAIAWRSRRRGEIVICDRHFYADYRAHDVVDRTHKPWPIRLHGYLLDRWYPRPDVVIALEAPAEVLLARKGEGTLDSLRRRQQEYRALDGEVARYASVDATRPVSEVVTAAARIVRAHAEQR
jgi:thymidylate kinase